jgi:Tol biopolymer transport system component
MLVAVPGEGLERISSPAWAPDASRIYFVGTLTEREGRDYTYYEQDVFAIDYSGGEPRRLTSTLDVGGVVPAPDGKTLLVGRYEDRSEFPFGSGLWLMDTDGKNARRLLGTGEEQRDIPGSWSPDGRTIAFTRCRFVLPDEHGQTENTCAVYVVSADGSGMRKLADRSSQPAFSPDGKRISYVSDRDEYGLHQTGEDEADFANELYVMDADGVHQRRLTQSESLDEAAPSWSPDATRIVFDREGPASFREQLMVVVVAGSCSGLVIGNARDASVSGASFNSPAWRPGRLTGQNALFNCAERIPSEGG